MGEWMCDEVSMEEWMGFEIEIEEWLKNLGLG